MFSLLQILILVYLVVFMVLHYNVSAATNTTTTTTNNTNNNNTNTNNLSVTFYTKSQTRNFILADKDKFIASLDKANCLARQVATPAEYRSLAAQAAVSFSAEEQKRLRRAVSLAAGALEKMSPAYLAQVGIDKTRLLQQTLLGTWTLAKTRDSDVEMGMPHTRERVIFLSGAYLARYGSNNMVKMTRTLIHEFMHIYQRTFATLYTDFLRQNGWMRVPYNENDLRINPDLDKQVWKRRDDKRLYMAQFTTPQNPKNLKDVRLSESRYEHPFEWYAYKLGEEATF